MKCISLRHAVLAAALPALFALNAFADENPVYSGDSQHLTVPVIDTDEQSGFFQDVELEFAGGDLWRLTKVREGIPITGSIKFAHVVKVESNPVQVLIRVIAEFRKKCEQPGHITQRRTGNTFEVAVYYLNDTGLRNNAGAVECEGVSEEPAPGDSVGPDWRTYTLAVPLHVYGLKAGEYQYSVNGMHSGSFTLEADNHLQ